MAGWIKLYRQFTEWEWYRDNNTKIVFLHLLLTANIKDTKYMGMIVPKGSLITKIYSTKDPENTLCGQLELTHREARTALKKLSTTGEITVKTTNKFSLINIVNYSVYQENETEEGQSNDNQTTNQRQTNDKHRIRSKELKNIDIATNVSISPELLRNRYTGEQLKIIDEFFEVLKHTRRSAKLSDNIILNIYKDWDKHEPAKVIYALYKYIHTPALHDKKENYVLGIIRNATMADIENYKKAITNAPKGVSSKLTERLENIKEWAEDD